MEKTEDHVQVKSTSASANSPDFENATESLNPPAFQLKSSALKQGEEEVEAPSSEIDSSDSTAESRLPKFNVSNGFNLEPKSGISQLKSLSESGEQEIEPQADQAYQLAADSTPPPVDGNPNGDSSGDNKANNTGLPDQLKSGVESLSGFSMNDVKVHYNSDKPAQLKAHAFAQGTDIHLASGQEKHLPHEAWHVVQQKQGRVQPTTQLKAVNINDDAGLEKEADEMGAKALQMKAESSLITKNKSSFSQVIIQKKPDFPNSTSSDQTPVVQRALDTKYTTGSGKSSQKINSLIDEYNGISQQLSDGEDKADKKDELKISQFHLLEKIRKLVSSNLKEKSKDAKGGKLKFGRKNSSKRLASASKRDELELIIEEINTEQRSIGANLLEGSTIHALGDMDDKDKNKVGRGLKHMYKKMYLKKGSQGRLLSDNETKQLLDIEMNSGLGSAFLDGEIKTGTYTGAINYINAKNYKNWLQIHPNKRMLITSLISQAANGNMDPNIKLSIDELKLTPAYSMGLSLAGNIAEIRAHTAERWEKTMNTDSKLSEEAKAALNANNDPERAQELRDYETKNNNAIKILKKVFLLLHAGLKENTEGNGYQDWTENVSTALSHGGRVNIKIPKLQKGGNEYELLDWLGITQDGHKNKDAGVVKRSFGTHNMEINDEKGVFKETGGKGAALKNKFGSTKIYGMDLAVGGFGEEDFNGEYILPDGANGHMFIGFKPPTKTNSGALEIGIETTGPGAHSNVGYVHNWNSTEATANPLSSSGGAKADKHGYGKLDWGRIDLEDLEIPFTDHIQSWLGKLQELEAMYDEAKERGDVDNSHLVGKR